MLQTEAVSDVCPAGELNELVLPPSPETRLCPAQRGGRLPLRSQPAGSEVSSWTRARKVVGRAGEPAAGAGVTGVRVGGAHTPLVGLRSSTPHAFAVGRAAFPGLWRREGDASWDVRSCVRATSVPGLSVLRGQWTRLWRKRRRRSGGGAAAPDAPRGEEAAGHRGADALTSRLPGAAHRDVKNVRTRKNPRLCSLKGKFTFASPAGIRVVQSRALASGKGPGGPAQRVNGPDAHAVISGARQSNMSPQTCGETSLFLLCGSLNRGTNFEQSSQQSVLFPASWFAAT